MRRALACSKMSKIFSEKDIPHLKEQIATKMYNPLYVPLVQHVVSCLCACGGCLMLVSQVARTLRMVSMHAACACMYVCMCARFAVRRGDASTRTSPLITHMSSHVFAFAHRSGLRETRRSSTLSEQSTRPSAVLESLSCVKTHAAEELAIFSTPSAPTRLVSRTGLKSHDMFVKTGVGGRRASSSQQVYS